MLKYFGRFVSGTGALLAILFFFMPWVLVSCGGQEIGTLSGWELAAGANLGGEPIQNNPLLFILLALAILAFLLVALPHAMTFAVLEILLGVAAAAFLLFAYSQMRGGTIRDGAGGIIQIKPQLGMMGSFVSYFLIIVGGILEGGIHAFTQNSQQTRSRARTQNHSPSAPESSAREPLPTPSEPVQRVSSSHGTPDDVLAKEETASLDDSVSQPQVSQPQSVAPSPTAVLVVSGEPRHYQIPLEGDDIFLGRGTQCQVCFQDEFVSRRHARLRYAQGQWFIQDQGSRGGTFVNGQRVNAARLNDGDIIRIGKTTVRFQIN